MSTAFLKASAVTTASWPVSASATSRVSAGLEASLTSRTSAIRASLRVVRPAVSRISTSEDCRRAASSARRVMAIGVSPSCSGSTATPASSPRMRSCSRAAGRDTSSDASSTPFFCFSLSIRASLPVVVVLPDPCRPTMRTTTGAGRERLRGDSPGPSVSTRASWTILTTIWPGWTDLRTSWPTALPRTEAMNDLTTGSATSASSRARRTDLSAPSTSASLSAPLPWSASSAPVSFSVSPSNNFHCLSGRR